MMLFKKKLSQILLASGAVGFLLLSHSNAFAHCRLFYCDAYLQIQLPTKNDYTFTVFDPKTGKEVLTSTNPFSIVAKDQDYILRTKQLADGKVVGSILITFNPHFQEEDTSIYIHANNPQSCPAENCIKWHIEHSLPSNPNYYIGMKQSYDTQQFISYYSQIVSVFDVNFHVVP